jgi:hypothetical protein
MTIIDFFLLILLLLPDIAFVASTSTNGTVALSSVKVEIAVDDQQHTQVLDVQAQILFTWFRDTPSVPTLLKVFDDLVTSLRFTS